MSQNILTNILKLLGQGDRLTNSAREFLIKDLRETSDRYSPF